MCSQIPKIRRSCPHEYVPRDLKPLCYRHDMQNRFSNTNSTEEVENKKKKGLKLVVKISPISNKSNDPVDINTLDYCTFKNVQKADSYYLFLVELFIHKANLELCEKELKETSLTVQFFDKRPVVICDANVLQSSEMNALEIGKSCMCVLSYADISSKNEFILTLAIYKNPPEMKIDIAQATMNLTKQFLHLKENICQSKDSPVSGTETYATPLIKNKYCFMANIDEVLTEAMGIAEISVRMTFYGDKLLTQFPAGKEMNKLNSFIKAGNESIHKNYTKTGNDNKQQPVIEGCMYNEEIPLSCGVAISDEVSANMGQRQLKIRYEKLTNTKHLPKALFGRRYGHIKGPLCVTSNKTNMYLLPENQIETNPYNTKVGYSMNTINESCPGNHGVQNEAGTIQTLTSGQQDMCKFIVRKHINPFNYFQVQVETPNQPPVVERSMVDKDIQCDDLSLKGIIKKKEGKGGKGKKPTKCGKNKAKKAK